MQPCGFFIKQLSIKGKHRQDVVLKFSKGLNVISGPSNTGKTYILQCINYMFGSRKEPKYIKENLGYSHIYLQLENYDGIVISLVRSLIDKSIYIYDCKIEKIEKGNYYKKFKLIELSKFLLEFSNIKISKIRKNNKGGIQTLTFRNYMNLIMLDEMRITTEISPIFSGMYFNKSVEKSIFNTILSGKEDARLIIPNSKEKKVKLNYQLDLIKFQIRETEEDISRLRKAIEQSDEVNNKIENAKKIIEKTNRVISKKMEAKNSILGNKEIIEKEIINIKGLLVRFSMLKENYLSDLERLEFIAEGTYYIDQLSDCSTQITNNCELNIFIKQTCNSIEKHKKLEDICKLEISKLNNQIKELNLTRSKLENELSLKQTEIKKLTKQIEDIELELQNELNPQKIRLNEKLDTIKFKQNEINNLENIFLEKQFKENSLKDLLRVKLRLFQEVKQLSKYEDSIVKDNEKKNYEIIKQLEELEELIKWKFNDIKINKSNESTNIQINENTLDIRISEKEKESFGKGYRAILNSIFLYAILEYSREKNLYHPGLLILDTPFQQQCEFGDSIKNKFWNILANVKGDSQIIVAENIEPPLEIKEKINYISFFSNDKYVKSGLFPDK